MLLEPGRRRTSLAAERRTDCSRLTWYFGSPAKTPLQCSSSLAYCGWVPEPMRGRCPQWSTVGWNEVGGYNSSMYWLRGWHATPKSDHCQPWRRDPEHKMLVLSTLQLSPMDHRSNGRVDGPMLAIWVPSSSDWAGACLMPSIHWSRSHRRTDVEPRTVRVTLRRSINSSEDWRAQSIIKELNLGL